MQCGCWSLGFRRSNPRTKSLPPHRPRPLCTSAPPPPRVKCWPPQSLELLHHPTSCVAVPGPRVAAALEMDPLAPPTLSQATHRPFPRVRDVGCAPKPLKMAIQQTRARTHTHPTCPPPRLGDAWAGLWGEVGHTGMRYMCCCSVVRFTGQEPWPVGGPCTYGVGRPSVQPPCRAEQ